MLTRKMSWDQLWWLWRDFKETKVQLFNRSTAEKNGYECKINTETWKVSHNEYQSQLDQIRAPISVIYRRLHAIRVMYSLFVHWAWLNQYLWEISQLLRKISPVEISLFRSSRKWTHGRGITEVLCWQPMFHKAYFSNIKNFLNSNYEAIIHSLVFLACWVFVFQPVLGYCCGLMRFEFHWSMLIRHSSNLHSPHFWTVLLRTDGCFWAWTREVDQSRGRQLNDCQPHVQTRTWNWTESGSLKAVWGMRS